MWKSLRPQRIMTAVSLVLSEEPGRPSSPILGTIIEWFVLEGDLEDHLVPTRRP